VTPLKDSKSYQDEVHGSELFEEQEEEESNDSDDEEYLPPVSIRPRPRFRVTWKDQQSPTDGGKETIV